MSTATAAGPALPAGKNWAYGGPGFEPRHSGERRIAYDPIWDIQKFEANLSGDVNFFSQKSPDLYVTNSKGGGQVNVYRSMEVSRVLLIPLPGTSLVDLLEFLRCRFEFEIQGDRAYHLLMLPHQPGIGLQSPSIDSHGAPITGYAADMGSVIIGGGIEYNVVVKPPKGGLRNPNAFNVRCQLEAMVDKTIG